MFTGSSDSYQYLAFFKGSLYFFDDCLSYLIQNQGFLFALKTFEQPVLKVSPLQAELSNYLVAGNNWSQTSILGG